MGKNLNKISRLCVGLWVLLLGVILCPSALAFTASDLANGWTWWGEYGAVLATWEPYSGTEASRIVGAEIWRGFEIRDVILQGQFEFEDGYWIDASEPAGIQIVEFEIDPITGAFSFINRDFIAWRPEIDEEGNPDPTWEEFLSDNWDELGMDLSLHSARYGWVPEGPVIGRRQIYRIKPIVLFQYHVGPGQYEWGLTWGELSSTNNGVIPVGPPFPIDTEASGNLAIFTFETTYGTDEAILQVARDPGAGESVVSYFLPERTLSVIISPLNPYDEDGTSVTVEVDLSQVPGSGDIFWWRVGARNRQSTYRARPWPPISADNGWVWSDTAWLGSFSDVSPAHWAFLEVEALSKAGIVQGYADGTYRPKNPVARDSMAVYIARAMAEGDENVVDPGCTEAPFSDVDCDYWARKYIQYCQSQEVIQGYAEGDYQPLEPVNRAEMAVYIARAKGWVSLDADMTTAPALFADVPAGFWAGTAIEACLEDGVVQGYQDGNYHPESIVTRDQMAVYISRAFLE